MLSLRAAEKYIEAINILDQLDSFLFEFDLDLKYIELISAIIEKKAFLKYLLKSASDEIFSDTPHCPTYRLHPSFIIL